MGFYAVLAIFRPYNGGQRNILIEMCCMNTKQGNENKSFNIFIGPHGKIKCPQRINTHVYDTLYINKKSKEPVRVQARIGLQYP